MHQTFLQAQQTLESALREFDACCFLDHLDGTLGVRMKLADIEVKVHGIERARWVGLPAASHLACELRQYLSELDLATCAASRRSAA